MQQILFISLLLVLTACATLRPEPHLLEFSGVFQAIEKGSDPLSCYCENAGYVNSCGNIMIPLCLDNADLSATCVNVTVTGLFEYLEPADPAVANCPEKELRVLMVNEIICRD